MIKKKKTQNQRELYFIFDYIIRLAVMLGLLLTANNGSMKNRIYYNDD